MLRKISNNNLVVNWDANNIDETYLQETIETYNWKDIAPKLKVYFVDNPSSNSEYKAI